MRLVLPQRRHAETFTVVHRDQTFVVTIGYFPDGTAGEVFVDVAKSGNDLAHIARDAAIVVSIALQFGANAEILQHAVTRNNRGEAASILGAVIDSISTNSFSPKGAA